MSVAGVHTLLEAGRLRSDRVSFGTPAGLLSVEIERQDRGAIIWLEPPLPSCKPFDGPLPDVLEALRLPAAELGSWARAAVTPEADLLLPARDLAALRALQPDMTSLAALRGAHQLSGFCAVSLQTVEATSGVHSRFFAPHYGIPEDNRHRLSALLTWRLADLRRGIWWPPTTGCSSLRSRATGWAGLGG